MKLTLVNISFRGHTYSGFLYLKDGKHANLEDVRRACGCPAIGNGETYTVG